MYAADAFQVPFPFQPYPLQLHAMAAIRRGLAAGEVVVLESPTGTGKTQVLLNSVLSHLFEPVMNADNSNTQEKAQQKQQEEGKGIAGSSGGTYSKREEEGGMMIGSGYSRKRQRGMRSKSKREGSNMRNEEDAFLLEQDRREELREQRQFATSLSDSSCSSLESSSDISSDDENFSENRLPQQPLRKPKVYFSSRTHTQLQQLTEELRRTVFTQYPVRLRTRRQHIVIGESEHELEKKEKEEKELSDELPHKLRYVHVAGRQQLCLNAFLRKIAGGNNERLNELCLEAISYEHSKEGRAARKEQEKRNSSIPITDIEDSFLSSSETTKGCSYCRSERLKVLFDYVDISPRGLSEMRELGQRTGACPFLATRELLRGADVVLIPYPYLVSSEMRNTLLSGTSTNQNDTEDSQDREELDESMIKNKDELNTHTHASCFNYSHHGSNDKKRKKNNNKKKKKKNAPTLPPDFSGDVIVVDEAHNLVDYCRSMTTVTISVTELSLVRSLLNAYHTRYERRLLTRNKQRIREMVSFIDKLIQYLQTALSQTKTVEENKEKTKNTSPMEVHHFSSFVFDAAVDTVNVYRFLSFLDESRLLPKLHGLVAFIAENEEKQQQQQQQQLQQQPRKKRSTTTTTTINMENEMHEIQNSKHPNQHLHDSQDSFLSSTTQDRSVITSALHRFDAFLRWYSRSDEYTRIVLRRLMKDDGNNTEIIPQLQMLQLEPGTHTLFPLLQQAQSAVLAGGTMKPLALTCDLLLKRPLQLMNNLSSEENDSTLIIKNKGLQKEQVTSDKKISFTEEGHIVPPSSVAVFTLGVGPSGYRVELQHATRNQIQRHFEEVGATILNFSRVIPAGLIVFFTSYEIEELFVTHLHKSGLFDKINEVKRIFREPGRVVSSNNASSSLTADSTSASTPVDAMLAEYAKCIHTRNSGGALLFAVMGGKLSEGINFNDNLGRGVVVVGLPYANPSDVELQLYLGHVSSTRLSSTTTTTTTSSSSSSSYSYSSVVDTAVGCLGGGVGSSGEMPPVFSSPTQWGLFTDLCMRVVNQSTGRCIRHAGDYAVVILLDARYGERADIRKRIPSWMQPSVRVTHSFGECFRGVRDFFLRRQQQQQ
ncbi:putative DNA repair helicase [Trypanosoma theileri]|uniref:Putative DNA repair helicase n=1 Tax=Trypanosoma theileri TaxID=67003 RepID=A0A1X0P8Z2_9TRYP|nr:putative DNA repair helicase [Trypanosoma theileri]ORC93348.1 putative DNA repair helicase [Trypanosoma theileri]